MPYGVDKNMGGDSKENVQWMEKCVQSVMDSGKGKSSAIAICKAQMRKKHEAKSEAIEIEESILSREFRYRTEFMTKAMNSGRTYSQAKAEYDAHLAKNNFELGE